MDDIKKDEADGATEDAWPTALSYWRTFRADEFDNDKVGHVAASVAAISSTIPEWRAAVKGDATAAIGLVLHCRPPDRIGVKVDLPMTTLLNCAFENAVAALVLSHKLRQMPLDAMHRARLATSWLVHNLSLLRRNGGRRIVRACASSEGRVL